MVHPTLIQLTLYYNVGFTPNTTTIIMLLISTILLLSFPSISYGYQINRIPTSLLITRQHQSRVATAIYQRPPSYEPPYDNDYFYDDEFDDIRGDPFDYFDDYEDVDLPPLLGYNQNYEPPPQPNNLYRPQQDDGNFEFDMTPSNINRVPNNSRSIQQRGSNNNNGSGTISIKEQQTAYRNTKYNRSTSWQSKQNYRLDQKTPYGSSPNNNYPPSSNNVISNSNSNKRQDFQRTSGSPSQWSQQLYDTQNNFNPQSTTNQFSPSSNQQSSRYDTLPGQSPLLNTRSSYENGGGLVPNGTPSSGFNRDGIISPNSLSPNNSPNSPYGSPQQQQIGRKVRCFVLFFIFWN